MRTQLALGLVILMDVGLEVGFSLGGCVGNLVGKTREIVIQARWQGRNAAREKVAFCKECCYLCGADFCRERTSKNIVVDHQSFKA